MKKGKLTFEEIEIARKAITKYLKDLNKISKQRCWEEGQQLSGFFTWLGKQEHE